MDGSTALRQMRDDFVNLRQGYSHKSVFRLGCTFSLINLLGQQAKYLASLIYDDPRDRDQESAADYLQAESADLVTIYSKIQRASEVADPEVAAEVTNALKLMLDRIDDVANRIWSMAEPRLVR